MNLFENLQLMREANETEDKKIDLRDYTVKEFAEMIDEEVETIKDLMKNNDHLGYTDKPYYHLVNAVQKSTVKDNNKEIVAKFIYTNLFNRPEHRFYNGRGWGPTMRKTV